MLMMWFIWLPVVVIGILFFIRYVNLNETPYQRGESPLELLKRRYANGEISDEEFEKKKKKILE